MWVSNEIIRSKLPVYLTAFADENENRFQELIYQSTIHIRSKTGIPLPISEDVAPFWYIDTISQLVHIFALLQSGAIASEEQTMLIMKRWDLLDERLMQWRITNPNEGKKSKAGIFPLPTGGLE